MITLQLHLDDAQTILRALEFMDNAPLELMEDLEKRIEDEKELQNIDLNDCAGGACKL